MASSKYLKFTYVVNPFIFLVVLFAYTVTASSIVPRKCDDVNRNPRELTKLSTGWRFWRSETVPDKIIYDLRPDANDSSLTVLKPWILPDANAFIRDPKGHHRRPAEEPKVDLPYVKAKFDDSDWEHVSVPHDWAIAGPFYTGDSPPIGNDMGLLPVQGVGWYRRTLSFDKDDLDKVLYLDVDGAMSYPMVWLNGNLVGGWAYGYNSFRLDLTPYARVGKDNLLAIRVENPSGASSRWYPGAGLYRNVWLTKTDKLHVAHWGTHVTTSDVSADKATVNVIVEVENSNTKSSKTVEVETTIHVLDEKKAAAALESKKISVPAGAKKSIEGSVKLRNPRLWAPFTTGKQHLYVAVTNIYDGSKLVDSYETRFGVRDVKFDANKGVSVNGKTLRIQGVNQHHDLGSIGAAFNVRAAKRQLKLLRELGVNAIRTSHNPPAPELLDLTDEMGFLVLDEIYDCWEIGKTTNDFHLIFPDWREADLRAFMRRDRNHASVVAWSYGNEVVEQQVADERGAELSRYLRGIVEEEDSTRPSTISLVFARSNSSIAETVDIVSLNYQGEGLSWGSAYPVTANLTVPPQYDNFREEFPDRMIMGTEVAWSLSSRGTFLFPVTSYNSAPANDSFGGDSMAMEICSYELYSSIPGCSPDRVFLTQDEHPFVAGGFVWSGWDYLGEPFPYKARSAYGGIIDLAGFKKTRFYQYQARWRPDLAMAHIVPHWTWPGREGEITPVHLFSTADEAEAFLNGKSLGRMKRKPLEYRFRWDKVKYEPGEVHVQTWKNGKPWATDTVRTAGKAAKLKAEADCKSIASDGEDLCFVTVTVEDQKGIFAPEADNEINFSVHGPGQIVATDNGYQNDRTAFPSPDRKAFNGMVLGIVRAQPGARGSIKVQMKK